MTLLRLTNHYQPIFPHQKTNLGKHIKLKLDSSEIPGSLGALPFRTILRSNLA